MASITTMSYPEDKTNTPIINAPIVDWSKTPLTAEYTGPYVKIIDDVFTPEECAELLAIAESDAAWEQAAVHSGNGPDEKYIDTTYRNSLRILRYDRPTAEKIYAKLAPYVRELATVAPSDDWASIFGPPGCVDGTWTCVGVNERLSYLKYGEGHFFARHRDGLAPLPDGRKAFVTVQIYLGEDGLEGGATRLYGTKNRYFDVEAKKGRVLIFQHSRVYHSGEEVTKGVKYTLRTDFLFRENVPGQAQLARSYVPSLFSWAGAFLKLN